MLFCGLVSLALTIVNIICIIGTGWAILRIKEVTPQAVPQGFSHFWTNDVKVHREYLNKGTTNLLDEAREAMSTGQPDSDKLENKRYSTLFDALFEKVEQDDDYINILEWGKSFTPATVWHDALQIEDEKHVDIDPLGRSAHYRVNTLNNTKSALVRRNTSTFETENNDHFDEVGGTIQAIKCLRQERRKSVKQKMVNQRLQNQVSEFSNCSLPKTNGGLDEEHGVFHIDMCH